jgi:hypothetical protein
MKLFVSKINDLVVMQDSTSALSSQNKSSSREDIKKGKNKSIDLGEGSKKLTSSFISQDEVTTERLFKILSKDRKCTITDKFLGVIKCNVLSYSIVNSDKHIGTTKFKVEFSITEDFNLKINYRGRILHNIHELEEKIKPKYIVIKNNSKTTKITEDIISTDAQTKSDYLTKFKSTNRYLNNINRDVNYNRLILNDKDIISKGFDTLSTLSIKNENLFKYNDYLSGFKAIVPNGTGVQGAYMSNENANALLFNKVLLITNLKKLLLNDISTLPSTITNIIRVCKNNITIQEHLIIADNRIDFNEIIYNALQFRDFNHLQIVEVRLRRELISRYVYKKYGNLDYFEDILRINNLQDDTILSGVIKMFEDVEL